MDKIQELKNKLEHKLNYKESLIGKVLRFIFAGLYAFLGLLSLIGIFTTEDVLFASALFSLSAVLLFICTEKARRAFEKTVVLAFNEQIKRGDMKKATNCLKKLPSGNLARFVFSVMAFFVFLIPLLASVPKKDGNVTVVESKLVSQSTTSEKVESKKEKVEQGSYHEEMVIDKIQKEPDSSGVNESELATNQSASFGISLSDYVDRVNKNLRETNLEFQILPRHIRKSHTGNNMAYLDFEEDYEDEPPYRLSATINKAQMITSIDFSNRKFDLSIQDYSDFTTMGICVVSALLTNGIDLKVNQDVLTLYQEFLSTPNGKASDILCSKKARYWVKLNRDAEWVSFRVYTMDQQHCTW